MGDYGVASTWNDVKAGREKEGLNLWMDVVTMNEKAVANGQVERWDAVIFEPSPNAPAGAIRVYGTDEQVEAFIRSDDFVKLVNRAGLLLNGFGYRRFMTGQALADGFAQFTELVNSL